MSDTTGKVSGAEPTVRKETWCSQQQTEGEDVSELPNRVADMLSGRAVFITGGTGFMGKVLLEKILRACSDVDTVYLLIRNKKGKEPRKRLDELFASPVSAHTLCRIGVRLSSLGTSATIGPIVEQSVE
jgi:hypothetical protein